MGSVGMDSKQVQNIHSGLRESPAYPAPQGPWRRHEGHKQSQCPLAMGHRVDGGIIMLRIVRLRGCDCPDMGFPQRTQMMPKDNLTNF